MYKFSKVRILVKHKMLNIWACSNFLKLYKDTTEVTCPDPDYYPEQKSMLSYYQLKTKRIFLAETHIIETSFIDLNVLRNVNLNFIQ